jgi:hypothetical protein
MPGYKESTQNEDENLDIGTDISLGDDELSFQDSDEDSEFTTEKEIDATLIDDEDPAELLANKKSKGQTFSLQARRAIEDHLEQRRLRKELDYLYDDEFANPEEPKK